MSIDGRIDINVLFQDKSGQRLKVVSLNDSKEYTTGSIAFVSGTCGTSAVGINLAPPPYRNAAGDLVNISLQRVALRASGNGAYLTQDNGSVTLISQLGRVSVTDIDEQEVIRVSSLSGTVFYEIAMWG